MLKVPIEQIEPGMVLARPVANPEKPDHTLLKAGYEMEADKVARLRAIGVSSIWINYPGLDFLDDVLDTQVISQQQELYSSLKENFNEAQQESLSNIDYRPYVEQMRNLFHSLLAHDNISAAFVNELHGQSNDIYRHCTAVASMAMLIGLRSENQLLKARSNMNAQQAKDLTSLGTGCLLHDMGKTLLPEELQTFRISAMDLGSAEWQKHTEIGYDMLKAGLDPVAAQVIVNHHQHYDGSGFPKRKQLNGTGAPFFPLKGTEIHIFCRIACLANYFDSFRYLPDGRTAPTVVALKRMKKPGYASWFDPELYRIFTKAMPAFSPGEQVTLNDGRNVVVIQVNDDYPCKPIVRPINLDDALSPAAREQKEKQPIAEDKPAEPTAVPAEQQAAQEDAEDKNDPSKFDIDLSQDSRYFIQKVGEFDVSSFLH
ncbi:MAG: HD domain-containing protein [Sedimentisphaerales bacterium]|nr:HD domain-containing protein [Sedimentisphaerales bacterium]MBN2841551.1 HD domain-containing protein [Sedimentisphaerales bacterium]